MPGTAAGQTDCLARACRALMVGVGTRASACSYLLDAQAARAARASAHRSVEFHKSWGRNQNQRVNGFWLQEKSIDLSLS